MQRIVVDFLVSICDPVGLTQQNPRMQGMLPMYALPDLANMGRSWVFPITKYVNASTENSGNTDAPNDPQPLLIYPLQRGPDDDGDSSDSSSSCIAYGMPRVRVRRINFEMDELLQRSYGGRVANAKGECRNRMPGA